MEVVEMYIWQVVQPRFDEDSGAGRDLRILDVFQIRQGSRFRSCAIRDVPHSSVCLGEFLDRVKVRHKLHLPLLKVG